MCGFLGSISSDGSLIASVVTIAAVKSGEELSLDNLWVKRPGDGPIMAKDLDSVLGRVARRDIAANVQLSPWHFS